MMLDTGRLNAVVVEELHAFESDFDGKRCVTTHPT